MWYPDGYISLSAIGSRISWDSDLVSTSIDEDTKKTLSETEFSNMRSIEYLAYDNWMHAALFDTHGDKFRLCLSSGLLLKFDRYILSWWLSATPKIGKGVSTGYPKEYDEREAWSDIKFDALDLNHGAVAIDLPDWQSAFQPISGCPLCIREVDLIVPLENLPYWLLNVAPKFLSGEINQLNQKNSQDLVSSKAGSSGTETFKAKFEAIDVHGTVKEKSVGRPSLKHEAAQAYWNLYPAGHERVGMTWKLALAGVNVQLPKPISLDTLKRAVRETQ